MNTNVLLSAHARQRAAERGCTESEIFQTVQKPGFSYAAKGATYFVRNFGNRQVEVRAKPHAHPNHWIVVTVVVKVLRSD
jgi:hypothetical protein